MGRGGRPLARTHRADHRLRAPLRQRTVEASLLANGNAPRAAPWFSPDLGDVHHGTGRDRCAMPVRPNVLVILTDQQRYPPPYESEELAAYRREHLPAVEHLRQNGISFRHHYPMAAACAPSRASLLTGQYPSLHGVTQTDGVGKTPTGTTCSGWRPTAVPTLGDWFRAGGYRTYFKGKWHASHPHLDADDGDGLLLSIDDDGTPIDGKHPADTLMPTCSTTTASQNGSAPSRTASASTIPAWSRIRSPPTRPSRCSSASMTTRADSRG